MADLLQTTLGDTPQRELITFGPRTELFLAVSATGIAWRATLNDALSDVIEAATALPEAAEAAETLLALVDALNAAEATVRRITETGDLWQPERVAVVIDTSVVSGGGFLDYDDERNEYAGAVQLVFQDLALSAVGLLTTDAPDGGISLLVMISAEDFPPVNLGFGFILTEVGGLFGVNRTAAVDVLRAGLKNKTLDAVLFPADPLRNAAQIVDRLRTVFPRQAEQYLFGPMGHIEWGRPEPVLTIELALILEFPSPLRLLALGQFRALLPSEEQPLVRLQMDAVGVVDFDRGKIAVDATLYDSRILEYTLTGEMALRARWKGDPAFLLAVGGFNPRFQPPPAFPHLDRMTLALNKGAARVRMACYLALTSNTVQFGAHADLLIEVSKLRIEGALGFDALFQFSPFQFEVDIAAGVAVSWSGVSLASANLDLVLSGPSPWHVQGKAKVKVLFFSATIRIDEQLGGGRRPPPLPATDPLPELQRALADARNWRTQLPEGGRSLVRFRKVPTATPVLLHPLGKLVVRQQVVPLKVGITRFGNAPLGARRTYTLTLSVNGGPPAEEEVVEETFAPAQYFDMPDAEKLSAPSFERHPAGVEITTTAVTFPQEHAVTSGETYESDIVDDLHEPPAEQPEEPYRLPDERLDVIATFSAAGRAAAPSGADKYRAPGVGLRTRELRYVVAGTDVLQQHAIAEVADQAEGVSHAEAMAALRQHLKAEPTQRERLQVVALYETQEANP